MKQISSLIVLILIFSGIYSQNKENVDSLQNLLSQTKDKKEITDLYIRMASEMLAGNTDSAIYYAEKSLELSESINYEEGIANSYLSLGGGAIANGNFQLSVSYLMKSLEIFEEKKDSLGISKAYLKLGSTYYYLNDKDKAQKYNLLSLSFLNNENNVELRSTYNNIGLVYSSLNYADSALFYYQKSINLAEDKNNRKDIIYELGNIANLYAKKGDNLKAKDIYLEILELSKDVGDKSAVVICYVNLSEMYRLISEEKKERNATLQYNSMSLRYGDSALVFAKEMNSLFFISFGYQQLYESFKSKGDFKNACFNLESYLTVKDSLFDLEKISDLEKLEKQYHTEKQQIEIDGFK